VTVTDEEEETARVVIVKVAEVLPAGTVTEAGTVAAAILLLVNETMIPPAGADEARVTVPVDVAPPVTEVGFKLKELSVSGETVNAAVWDTPAYDAAIVTEEEEETTAVVIVKVAVVLPAGTVTETGAEAVAVSLLDKDTEIPPAGAVPERVTVP
jgi:hypothetical protein